MAEVVNSGDSTGYVVCIIFFNLDVQSKAALFCLAPCPLQSGIGGCLLLCNQSKGL